MDKKNYLSILAAIATAVTVAGLAMLAAPIAKPLAWALIIGIATHPYHERLLRRWPRHKNRAAGLMVLAVTVCFIVPLVGIIISFALNAPDWFSAAQDIIRNFMKTRGGSLMQLPFVHRIYELADRTGIDMAGDVGKLASGASAFLLNIATSTAKGLAELLFTLAVALFILYFIYRDGAKAVAAAVDRMGSHKERIKHYLFVIRSTTTAVAVGTIFTCVAQGITAGVGYFVADVPVPILWGALTAIAALVPVVGTGVIWVPVVIFVAVQGTYLKAILLTVWCLLFVGLADNAIRPLAVNAKIDISVLAVVIGAICGLTMMGILGLILGPLVFAVLTTIWHDLTGPQEIDEKTAEK
ncbi:MAG TPA: AI-2E family transporter [Desulfuromonadaceae bacterium]|jgi:predicted PurR-regulated permease PerM